MVTEIGKSKIEYRILIKANFSSKLYANNVVLNIPTPLNTAGVTCSASAGKAKYVPADNSIVWKYVAILQADIILARYILAIDATSNATLCSP